MKHLKSIILAGVISVFIFTSCEETKEIIDDLTPALTEAEVVEGLKSALIVSTDTSVSQVSALNGYFGDPLIKILMPEEAAIITENIEMLPFGQDYIDEMVLKMNRAAEDAAGEAAEVFWSAITEMTISDAFNILNGDDNAATQYLIDHTYNNLQSLYQPKVNASLDKALVEGVSANESWDFLTSNYNEVANSLIGQLAGLTPVDVPLDEYVTTKALDGLFVKIAEEEKQIRHDPLARVNDILKRVFGG
jgi:hypothetical protein